MRGRAAARATKAAEDKARTEVKAVFGDPGVSAASNATTFSSPSVLRTALKTATGKLQPVAAHFFTHEQREVSVANTGLFPLDATLERHGHHNPLHRNAKSAERARSKREKEGSHAMLELQRLKRQMRAPWVNTHVVALTIAQLYQSLDQIPPAIKYYKWASRKQKPKVKVRSPEEQAAFDLEQRRRTRLKPEARKVLEEREEKQRQIDEREEIEAERVRRRTALQSLFLIFLSNEHQAPKQAVACMRQWLPLGKPDEHLSDLHSLDSLLYRNRFRKEEGYTFDHPSQQHSLGALGDFRLEVLDELLQLCPGDPDLETAKSALHVKLMDLDQATDLVSSMVASTDHRERLCHTYYYEKRLPKVDLAVRELSSWGAGTERVVIRNAPPGGWD